MRNNSQPLQSSNAVAKCFFNGAQQPVLLSDMGVDHNSGKIYIPKVGNLEPDRRGSLSLTLIFTGSSNPSIAVANHSAFAEKYYSAIKVTPLVSGMATASFYGCKRQSSAIIQREFEGAWVIENAVVFTFQDYGNGSSGQTQINTQSSNDWEFT
jgi:hypothetical protein